MKEDSASIQQLLSGIIDEVKPITRNGAVASYIPELKKANPQHLAVALVDKNYHIYTAGNVEHGFTLQSISKVLSLLIALESKGEKEVFSRVGQEPTGDPFNSIIRLETYFAKKPLNPMINAGAITVTSMLPGSNLQQKIDFFLSFIQNITGNKNIDIDHNIFSSEKSTASRNRALAWFLKDLNVLDGDVEEVLDLYFMQCSIKVNTIDLAKIGIFLAFDGILFGSETRLCSPRHTRIVKSLMMMCGLYDGSGEFSVSVGIPSKSGVGGGILSTVPGRMGIGVFGPALDPRGNSLGGIQILKRLSETLNLSVL